MFHFVVVSEWLVLSSGELAHIAKGLTSISNHDFLDWSKLALWGRVGQAGEKTGPPHSQQAEAASDYSVPEHSEKESISLTRKKIVNVLISIYIICL